jgi:glucose dehydrogenase
MLRSTVFAALLTTLPLSALAQTADDLKNDEKTPEDVLIYGMGYSGQRYSPLTQINKENVSKMVPVWGYSLADLQGGESFSLVRDGVIYVTTHNATAAVDALTGKQVWRTLHEYPPETLRIVCCGIVNRGAAIYEGLIIRALMDNRMVALDAKTGKQVWMTQSPDPVTPAKRLLDDRRAAGSQRHCDRRCGRRRVQPSRSAGRLRRQDRQAPLAYLHDPRQGRTGFGNLGRRLGAHRWWQ